MINGMKLTKKKAEKTKAFAKKLCEKELGPKSITSYERGLLDFAMWILDENREVLNEDTEAILGI